MSTTVTYEGSTIATVNNNTKTLQTAGKYLTDDITLVDVSQSNTYYQAPSGIYYTANMVIPSTATGVTCSAFKGASELVSLEMNCGGAYQFLQSLQYCRKLQSVSFPSLTTYNGGNTNTCVGCTALKSMQLGSIGHPVTSINFNTKSRSGKTVTIYCTAIADVRFIDTPVDSGDTVIYRSSTTGEVLTA
jgi:hypothetical protein